MADRKENEKQEKMFCVISDGNYNAVIQNRLCCGHAAIYVRN